jgi:MFS-type transporter involved in bile tolerance (Atg22 family)
MITELVPAPKVYMFFALFNTVGKTSGFVGPFVTSAIINRAGGNANIAFWFLLGMGMAGCAVLAFVDTNKAKIDAANCKCLSEWEI